MTFDEVPGKILALLQQEGRVTYRALKRRFNLDDDYLADLAAELIDAKRLVVDEAGKVLVAVHRYEGYVAQALGDGIFALFGAPLAHENRPQRALYAALRMQEEMHRYADTLQGKGYPPLEEAEACFLRAIEIAQRQQGKSLELRAATSLTRLWQAQGKQAEAHHLLAEIYGWFTEGFGTKDLQEAGILLAALAETS